MRQRLLTKKGKLQFSDKKKRPLVQPFDFPLQFRREDFCLDFTTAFSDKSTTDNFVSDDDKTLSPTKRHPEMRQVELEHQKSRESQSVTVVGKFHWYWPQMVHMDQEKTKSSAKLEDVDDVSSESSIDSEEEQETLE